MAVAPHPQDIACCSTTYLNGAAGDIKASAGVLYWITASNANAAAQTFELNDATSGHASEKMIFTIPLANHIHCVFDPPIYFDTGIRIGVCHADIDILAGYA